LEWFLLNVAIVASASFWQMRERRATGLGLVYSPGMLLEIGGIIAVLTVINFLVLRWLSRRREPRLPLAFPDSQR
jgi:hypothetical protein